MEIKLSEEDSDTELGLTTKELAKRLHLQAETLHRSHSQTGAYFGIRPTKLPNGRLSWPRNAVERFMAGAQG